MIILVLSCDKNEDIFYPFYHCMEKYYPNHPEIIYATETINNPYYKTITKNYPLNKWTKRIRETLTDINDDKILLMIDDLFIREPVDTNRIKYAEEHLQGNIAMFNFEKIYDNNNTATNLEGFMLRNKGSNYELSLMCGLWQKDKLINVLLEDSDPWSVEIKQDTKGYDYYINSGNFIINFGYESFQPTNLVKGKWASNIIDFFDKENIHINYSKRGFYDIPIKKLSIITPYYKTLDLTLKLANVLIPQLTKEVEWIIVDDGCDEKELDKLKQENIKIYHIKSTNCHVGRTRNFGLSQVTGEFVVWVDSDDMVANNYISTILNKIDEEYFDYCYLSWQFLSNKQEIIINKEPPDWNHSNWARIYRYNKIKNIKFNETIQIGEDYEFNHQFLNMKNLIQGNSITDIIYYYNNSRQDSLTHKGE